MDREEAIKILKSRKCDQEVQMALETLIPELKESEDERIRKKVIEVLKLNIRGAESQMQASRGVDRTFEVYACNKAISWLEKQGSQNLANSAKTCKDEQNPAWSEEDEGIVSQIMTDLENCESEWGSNKGEEKAWLESLKGRVQPQPKSEWSEEDEKTTQRIVDTIMKYAISPHSIINGDKPNLEYAKEFESWLKSLKFRIQPQPKQEWSEEDEKMVGCIRGIIERYAFSQSAVDVNGDLCEPEFIEPDEWLKALKERVQTQTNPTWSGQDNVRFTSTIQVLEFARSLDSYNQYGKKDIRDNLTWLRTLKERYTWRPSEEQMTALSIITDSGNSHQHEVLDSLYYDLKDLKKLKG